MSFNKEICIYSFLFITFWMQTSLCCLVSSVSVPKAWLCHVGCIENDRYAKASFIFVVIFHL